MPFHFGVEIARIISQTRKCLLCSRFVKWPFHSSFEVFLHHGTPHTPPTAYAVLRRDVDGGGGSDGADGVSWAASVPAVAVAVIPAPPAVVAAGNVLAFAVGNRPRRPSVRRVCWLFGPSGSGRRRARLTLTTTSGAVDAAYFGDTLSRALSFALWTACDVQRQAGRATASVSDDARMTKTPPS